MAPVSHPSPTVARDDHLAEIESLIASHNLPNNNLSPKSLSSAQVADLTPRSENTDDKSRPGEGSVDPGSINMQGILALFAILGAIFVLGGIWFFFWAKNGGFVWREGDWEEYKSTVLRRKGPDGRTLSNATKSTKLGGGSVVYTEGYTEGYTDYDGDDARRTMTGGNETYAATETSEKPKKTRGKRIREKFKRKGKREQDEWEGQHDEDMRAYRNEKAARVGGINREADGTYQEGSTEYTGTNPQMSEWAHSDLGDGHRKYDEHTEAGQQRNVSGYSFTVGDATERTMERDQQRHASGFSFAAGEDTASYVTEEHRLRDEGTTNATSNRPPRRNERSSQRPRGPRPTTRQSSPKKRDQRTMPGGYTAPLDMSSTSSNYTYEQVAEEESGTRSYRHPIPELSKGYRRGGGKGRRRDSLSDSDGDGDGDDYDSRYS